MPDKRYVLAVKKIRSSVVPFVLLLFFFVVVSWYIIKPLAIPLIWSILFSYFAHPLYKFMHRRLFGEKYRNVAAAISTGVILIFIAIPLLLLTMFVTREGIRISRHIHGERPHLRLLSGHHTHDKEYPDFRQLRA